MRPMIRRIPNIHDVRTLVQGPVRFRIVHGTILATCGDVVIPGSRVAARPTPTTATPSPPKADTHGHEKDEKPAERWTPPALEQRMDEASDGPLDGAARSGPVPR